MKKLRKWIKDLNEKINTRKVLFLIGIHFGLFVWLSRSIISIFQGEEVIIAFFNNILFGIFWAIPFFVLGILLPKMRNE